MIKLHLSFLFLFFLFNYQAQIFNDVIAPSQSMIKKIVEGDSITYYQCHVEEGTQRLITTSGQTVTGKPQPYTITEKYTIIKNKDHFLVNYYTSSLTVFPNKKFSGLKIREKDYWQFKRDSTFRLSETGIKVLLSLENKGREAMEYDYPITKYTTNQLIIKHKNDFKQLVIDGQYFISKLIHH